MILRTHPSGTDVFSRLVQVAAPACTRYSGVAFTPDLARWPPTPLCITLNIRDDSRNHLILAHP